MCELITDCICMLLIVLSVLGNTVVILFLIGAVKGLADLIDHKHDDEE